MRLVAALVLVSMLWAGQASADETKDATCRLLDSEIKSWSKTLLFSAKTREKYRNAEFSAESRERIESYDKGVASITERLANTLTVRRELGCPAK